MLPLRTEIRTQISRDLQRRFQYSEAISISTTMSYSKVKPSIHPYPPTTVVDTPSTNKTIQEKSPLPIINNTKETYNRKKSDGSVSDASTYSLMGKLTEAPGRLTPTCPGRMKAPPVCRDRGLKRVASTVSVMYFCWIVLVLIMYGLTVSFIYTPFCADSRHSVLFNPRGS